MSVVIENKFAGLFKSDTASNTKIEIIDGTITCYLTDNMGFTQILNIYIPGENFKNLEDLNSNLLEIELLEIEREYPGMQAGVFLNSTKSEVYSFVVLSEDEVRVFKGVDLKPIDSDFEFEFEDYEFESKVIY